MDELLQFAFLLFQQCINKSDIFIIAYIRIVNIARITMCRILYFVLCLLLLQL